MPCYKDEIAVIIGQYVVIRNKVDTGRRLTPQADNFHMPPKPLRNR